MQVRILSSVPSDMNKNIKRMYLLMCSKDFKYRKLKVRNNFKHAMSNWGVTCIDVDKISCDELIPLLPESLWGKVE